jgi:NAD(P) transhydrogenase subunit alpha
MSETTEVLLEKARELSEKAGELANEAGEIARQASEALQTSGAVDATMAAAHGGPGAFVFQFAIFVLSIFVGYYVVWSVTPALHTPLMAVTNAISSVIVVGALLAVGVSAASGAASLFGFVALVLAAVNIFGGFLVTQRMLAMYKKKQR